MVEAGHLPIDRLNVRIDKLVEHMETKGFDGHLIGQVAECLYVTLERGDLRQFGAIVIAVENEHPEFGFEHLDELLENCHNDTIDELDDLIDTIEVVLRPPESGPCRPVDIDRLDEILTSHIDPTTAQAPAAIRVLTTINGLDTQPLAPPEPCVGLDFPAWRYLRDHDREWLLPGIGELADNTVVAVQSNPTFVESFLVGLNRQTLFEMRWRNIATATHCTPLRIFWDRVNVSANQRVDDIVGIRNWDPTTTLGDPLHLPPQVSGTNLVLVFRSSLFRRYPATIVSLTPATNTGSVDWTATPEMDTANRVSPTFQGKVGDDLTFFGFSVTPAAARDHWVVLEEPPPGYLFRHPAAFPDGQIPDLTGVADGAAYADKTFDDPTVVLIRGDRLIPERTS